MKEKKVLEFWRFENVGEFENIGEFENLRIFMIFLSSKNLDLFFVNGFSIYRKRFGSLNKDVAWLKREY